jgi:YVTN family beta-propeller protein
MIARQLNEVGPRPWGIGITADSDTLYTANGPSNDVSVIDADSRTVVRRVAAGRSPWGVAISVRQGAP